MLILNDAFKLYFINENIEMSKECFDSILLNPVVCKLHSAFDLNLF